MALTCRASSEHPEMPQVVLLLKMPCGSTSWTGTRVANIHYPLRSPSHEQDPRKRNALKSRVLRAAATMLNEQSNILTTTEQPTTSNADPPDRGLPLPHPGKATPNEQLHKVETWGAVSQQTTLTIVAWVRGQGVTDQGRQFLQSSSTNFGTVCKSNRRAVFKIGGNVTLRKYDSRQEFTL